MRRQSWFYIIPLVALLLAVTVRAADITDLRAEVEELRKDLAQKDEGPKAPIAQVDSQFDRRYGPDAKVKSASSKLYIGGLIQTWYQAPQKDVYGNSTQVLLFPPGNATPQIQQESNRGNYNSTFRIRRSELHMGYEINDKVSGFILLDPARESNSFFYPLPTFPKHNAPSGEFTVGSGAGATSSSLTTLLQTGVIPASQFSPHLLQDCYINVANVIPHHTFTMGQFKPPAGEEAFRNSGQLDFVERAMVTGINNVRDIGAMISGTFFQDRLKYSAGFFNGPSGTILSDPEITEAGNRPDDNNSKDFSWRIAGRPVWDTKRWFGRLEIGGARTDGQHGASGQEYDPDFSVNGLNRQKTSVSRSDGWVWYRPNGPVKGFWMRGEWGEGHDRYGSGALTSLLGIGSVDLGATGPRGGNGFTQRNPDPVTAQGWFFSTGYYMPESIFADKLKKGGALCQVLSNTEFAFRYEVYQNVALENPANPDQSTLQFKTSVFTGGVNYYISGRGTKVQLNYMIVRDPTDHGNPQLGLREVKNNVFVVNFQVGF